MNLFPCFWSQPLPRGVKPIKNLADHHFPPRTLRISRPAPEAVKAERPKRGFADLTDDVTSRMPIEELCLNETPVDTTAIDQLLKEMNEQCSR